MSLLLLGFNRFQFPLSRERRCTCPIFELEALIIYYYYYAIDLVLLVCNYEWKQIQVDPHETACLFGRIYLTPCIGILIVSKMKCECQLNKSWLRSELGVYVWSPCGQAEGEFCPSASTGILKLRTRVLLGDDWTQEGALALNAHYDEKHSSCWICVQGSWAQLISADAYCVRCGERRVLDPYLWDSRLAGWQASLLSSCLLGRLFLTEAPALSLSPQPVLPMLCLLSAILATST